MKLSSFNRVRDLVDTRHCLQAQRLGALDRTIRVVVPMEGFQPFGGPQGLMNYDEATMSAAVRPAVVAEIDRRLAINAEALIAAGVEVD